MANNQPIFIFILNLSFFILFPLPALSHPLCTDSTNPVYVNQTLEFCRYSGRTCCGSTEDSELHKLFQSMNVSDPNCSSLLKSILCAKCDVFSAELFTVSSFIRPIPVLCNSTVSSVSSQTQAAEDFCSQVWETCENVSILDSPFAPTLQGQVGPQLGSNVTKLTDLWQSKTDFCNAFGGASTNQSVCFNGEPITLNNTNSKSVPPPPKGLCLEKIGNGSYLNMVAHPDGSNRAFFSNQPGKIWLATIPEQESGEAMGIDESSPFVDLTDQVEFDTQFGMMGMAFHPKFAQNGRFFASFNCDKVKWPGCSGRCACNSDVNCDPSKIPKDSGGQPCQYHTVIAEYTANGTSSPSTAKTAKPREVRRIFTMGLPFTSDHGGQILFGPDGYLYYMMGDGGGATDPYNFAQNKKSLLGKIMRLNVDVMPSRSEISKLGLWGNYSIPKDNPFQEDEEMQQEIWALGLRNPWRCSFDSQRPSYFMCADTGKDTYEEVDIISKNGNYGWKIYEGTLHLSPITPLEKNITEESGNLIFPILGYNHSEVNTNEGSAAIIGGYFYRSMTDPCTYGKYLYADLYAGAMWAGTETPEDSGNFTAARIPFQCSPDTPIQCKEAPGSSSDPSLGYIFSFGQDNRNDIFLLTSTGVYRIVRPSRCHYACSKENATAATRIHGTGSPTASPPGSSTSKLSYSGENLFFLLFLLLSLVFWGF